MKSFAVITPTIGSEHLRYCIDALIGQPCIHYIVIDGREAALKVHKILDSMWNRFSQCEDNVRLIQLQQNVGKGWYGHRVYAAASFLVNEDVLCYVDEDNWVERNYIEEFQKVFAENKYQWAYTLRNIVQNSPLPSICGAELVCQDNCESLGHWPVAFDKTRHHIDTGCFAIPRELAVKVGHHWYGQWGADRQFFAAVKEYAPSFGCTMKHTLNYRMGGDTNLATTEMFLQGNKLSEQAYVGERNYPWHEQRNPTTQWTYRTTQPKQP